MPKGVAYALPIMDMRSTQPPKEIFATLCKLGEGNTDWGFNALVTEIFVIISSTEHEGAPQEEIGKL